MHKSNIGMIFLKSLYKTPKYKVLKMNYTYLF